MFEAIKKWWGGKRDEPKMPGFVLGRGDLEYPWLTAPPTAAGVTVSEDTALSLSAVWCCVRAITGYMSLLPAIVYRRLAEGGKERATDSPVHQLLRAPNPLMTWPVFIETGMHHLLTHGNYFAEVVRQGSGTAVELWPLSPPAVSPKITAAGALVYEVQQAQGGTAVLPAADVVHVPGLGFDGLIGYSPIKLARESLGVSMACERQAAAFFGNGARPSGSVEYPGQLSEQGRENLRKSFEFLHRGPLNAGRVVLLEEGAKFVPSSFPPEEQQFLQSRQWNVVTVCQWFNLSPVFCHDLQRATWSNLESLYTQLVTQTLLPWIRKWEAELSRKLIRTADQETYFIEFLTDALLRGDTESRYRVYQIGITTGILQVNECRERENLNPLPEEPEPEPAAEEPDQDDLNTDGGKDDGAGDPSNPDGDPERPDPAPKD